jgi:UDP-glucose 4-epimerase
MRVLVTGGAGYIGSVTVEALVEAGHVPIVLDDLSTGHRGAVLEGVRLHVGSVGDGALVERVLRDEGVDAILHCAARSLVGESVADPAKYYRENVAGGIVLLEAARASGVRRIVFSSTAAVYGIPDAIPITEDAPARPINPYGETKRTFEAAMRWYGEAYGLRSVSLRYFNAAGASGRFGEAHEPETHLIPNILHAAGTGEELVLFGADFPTPDGTPIRDYIHVQDLAQAHITALEATDPTDMRTGPPGAASVPLVCNLGNGQGSSVLEVLHVAEAVVGRPIPHRIGPRRAGDPPVLIASAARAAEILGWRPERADLASILGSAWAWRRAHPGGYQGR